MQDILEKAARIRLLIFDVDGVLTDGTFEDRVTVTWNDASNTETGYRVYRQELEGLGGPDEMEHPASSR